MKRSLTALIPLLIAAVVGTAATAFPDTVAALSGETAFRFLPYFVYLLVFVLGGPSHQTRSSFLSLLLVCCTFILDDAAFASSSRSPESCLLLISLMLPVNFALFHSLPERSLFSFSGLRRLGLILAQAAVLFLVTIPPRTNMDGFILAWLLTPISPGMTLTWLSVLLFVNAAVILCIPRGQPGETGGLTLTVCLLAAFAMLSYDFPMWDRGVRRFVLLGFSLSAGLALAYAIVDQLWLSAFRDGLTGLPNRRALRLGLTHLTPPFTLAMVDIDHFKKINDTYGHDTGDQVLRFVAGKIRATPQGTAYRYGGEEFTIVMPGKSTADVKSILDELRAAIADDPFIMRGPNRPRRERKAKSRRRKPKSGRRIPVTISIGAAQDKPNRPGPEDVLLVADKALYRAKRQGRNRVSISR